MTPIDHRIRSMRFSDDRKTLAIACSCDWHETIVRNERMTGEGMQRAALAAHEDHRTKMAVRP